MNDQKNNGNFEFDEYSLAAISGSITHLDMSYCGIVNAKQLYYLENLSKLKLNNNNVRDLHGDVLQMLSTMKYLFECDLRNNPVIKSS